MNILPCRNVKKHGPSQYEFIIFCEKVNSSPSDIEIKSDMKIEISMLKLIIESTKKESYYQIVK